VATGGPGLGAGAGAGAGGAYGPGAGAGAGYGPGGGLGGGMGGGGGGFFNPFRRNRNAPPGRGVAPGAEFGAPAKQEYGPAVSVLFVE
jgi:hypothetical protein